MKFLLITMIQAGLCLIPFQAGADTADIVQTIRAEFQLGHAPTLANLAPGRWWHCAYFNIGSSGTARYESHETFSTFNAFVRNDYCDLNNQNCGAYYLATGSEGLAGDLNEYERDFYRVTDAGGLVMEGTGAQSTTEPVAIADPSRSVTQYGVCELSPQH